MWIPVTPGSELALAGATVLLNLSGSPITIGRARMRHSYANRLQPAALRPMPTPPVVRGNLLQTWHGMVRRLYSKTELCWPKANASGRTNRSRSRMSISICCVRSASVGTFHDNRSNKRNGNSHRKIRFSVGPPDKDIGFDRTVERLPFVPSDEGRLEQDCYEAYNIQVAGLVQRLRAIGSQRVVIGVSGDWIRRTH